MRNFPDSGLQEDIDMFTDLEYGSVDWIMVDGVLREKFRYVSKDTVGLPGMGISRFIGSSEMDSVKLDMFRTDKFIRDQIVVDGIRFAAVEEISAMKLEVISTAGRKRDFWDIHELLDLYGLKELLDFHRERYPYNKAKYVITGLTDFERAEDDEDPVCFKGKFWELIRMDIRDEVDAYNQGSQEV